MADISKITVLDGTDYNIKDSFARDRLSWYGTSSSIASSPTKEVVCTGFTLGVGRIVSVKFENTNSSLVSTLKLDVNGTGAKSIKYMGGNLPSADLISENSIITFAYDGTNYNVVGGVSERIDVPVTSVNGKIGDVSLNASDVGAIDEDLKGANNGVAELDSNGKVPSSQLNVMTGATSSSNGQVGLVPAPTFQETNKFLRSDGTWQECGKPMVILSYGNSTWQDFIDAYNANAIVYCRASSNSNPVSGSQTRLAFMAYVNNATNPTEVEFQYYRSVNGHSITQQGDQVYIYKITNKGTWTVTVRECYTRIVAGDNIEGSYVNGVLTLNATDTTYNDATTSVAGLMSASDKEKLDGIQEGATATNVSYDSTNKKITKTINGTTSDVVSASTLKTDMNLSNVENKSSATIRGELTSSNVTTALGYTPLNSSQGSSNVGKFLVVNSSGIVEPMAMSSWQGGDY